MNEFIEKVTAFFRANELATDILRVVGIILVAILVRLYLGFMIRLVGRRMEAKSAIEDEDDTPGERTKRISTLLRLIRQATYFTLWSVTLLIILSQLGVDIAPILAGAGIMGLAVGFGAQNLVRDLISGFFIILENQMRVGDVVAINGTGGLVEEINLRTVVLRDIGGVVHTFPNGTINTIANKTNEWSAALFNIGVAYKENIDEVIKEIERIAADLKEDEKFGPWIIADAEIFGVDELANSSVNITGRIKTKPIRQWAVGKEFLRRIKNGFDKAGIEIPFPNRTLHIQRDEEPPTNS